MSQVKHGSITLIIKPGGHCNKTQDDLHPPKHLRWCKLSAGSEGHR